MKLLLTSLAWLWIVTLAPAASGGDDDNEPGTVEVVAILVYTDWMEDAENHKNIYDELRETWHQQGAYFTLFDFTDDFSRTRTEEFADLLGLEELLEEYETETGNFLIVDSSSREVLTELEHATYTAGDVEEAIKEHF